MLFPSFTFSALVVAALASIVKADHDLIHHLNPRKAHHPNRNQAEGKRQGQTYTGQATYFADGLGACGITNSPSDFIVALNTPQYGGGSPGPECFLMITITDLNTGKSTVAQITDECPGCGYGSLDMSEGLFSFFEDISVGVFPISWYYNDAAPAPTTSAPAWTPPATTSTPAWTPPPPAPTTSTTPTTTWQPPTTSSTPPPPTTSTTSTASTSLSSNSSSSNSATTTGTGTNTGTGTATTTASAGAPSDDGQGTDDQSPDGNLDDSGSNGGGNTSNMNMLVANYGGVAAAGKQASLQS